MRISEIHQLWGSYFLWKRSKFNIDLKTAETSWEIGFCFWDICIWIGCRKLSVLRREHLPSAVNVLTNNLQNLHIYRDISSNSVALTVINKYDKCDVVDFSTVFWSSLACCLSKGLVKEDFLEICLTAFFGVRHFRNTSAMKVIFFRKCSKLDLDFKNTEINWENFFSFWVKCS